MPEETTRCPQPQVESPVVPPPRHRCNPRPRIASAYEQETLCTGLPGRGARGISSEWKEKTPPHPETILASPLRRGGGISGGALAGVLRGGRWGPSFPTRMWGWRLLLAERVRGWEKVNWGGGGGCRFCWEKAEGSLVPGCAGSSGLGRGTGRRLRGRGMGTGGRRGGKEWDREEEREGWKEIAITGVGCGAGNRDRSLAHRCCPAFPNRASSTSSQVKTAGCEGSCRT